MAGIDSPGLAGSPAIALEVVRLLQEAGLKTPPNDSFNPNRAPIITPKVGFKGLKMGPVGKNDSNGTDAEEKKMASNVICKCEKVTELEVIRAIHRSLPIDSTQAVRKRTRAGSKSLFLLYRICHDCTSLIYSYMHGFFSGALSG